MTRWTPFRLHLGAMVCIANLDLTVDGKAVVGGRSERRAPPGKVPEKRRLTDPKLPGHFACRQLTALEQLLSPPQLFGAEFSRRTQRDPLRFSGRETVPGALCDEFSLELG